MRRLFSYIEVDYTRNSYAKMEYYNLYKGAWIFSGESHYERKLLNNSALLLLSRGGGNGS